MVDLTKSTKLIIKLCYLLLYFVELFRNNVVVYFIGLNFIELLKVFVLVIKWFFETENLFDSTCL